MGTYAVLLDTEDIKDKRKGLKNREKDIHNIYEEPFCSLAPALFETLPIT